MTDSIALSNMDLIDGLRRFQEDFVKDFSFRDIIPDIKRLLSKTELMKISRDSSEADKINRLFFIFIYIKKDVRPLIECLKKSYRWLYNKILNSRDDKWIEDYRLAIHDIPDNQDWNIHRSEYLWDVQDKLKSLKRDQFLVLFGKLGFGKRWLAA
jgi:hypothetical protein